MYIPFTQYVYTFCAPLANLTHLALKGNLFLVYFFFFTKLSITFVGRMGIGAYV